MYPITFLNGSRSQNICSGEIKRVGNSESLSSKAVCPFSHSIIWSTVGLQIVFIPESAPGWILSLTIYYSYLSVSVEIAGEKTGHFLWTFTLCPSFRCYSFLSSREHNVSSCFQFCLLVLLLALLLLSPSGKTEQFLPLTPHASGGCSETERPPWAFQAQVSLFPSFACVFSRVWQSKHFCQEWTPQQL